jgi:hypothetical protein
LLLFCGDDKKVKNKKHITNPFQKINNQTTGNEKRVTTFPQQNKSMLHFGEALARTKHAEQLGLS